MNARQIYIQYTLVGNQKWHLVLSSWLAKRDQLEIHPSRVKGGRVYTKIEFLLLWASHASARYISLISLETTCLASRSKPVSFFKNGYLHAHKSFKQRATYNATVQLEVTDDKQAFSRYTFACSILNACFNSASQPPSQLSFPALRLFQTWKLATYHEPIQDRKLLNKL